MVWTKLYFEHAKTINIFAFCPSMSLIHLGDGVPSSCLIDKSDRKYQNYQYQLFWVILKCRVQHFPYFPTEISLRIRRSWDINLWRWDSNLWYKWLSVMWLEFILQLTMAALGSCGSRLLTVFFFVVNIQIEARPGGCQLALALSRNEQFVISMSLTHRKYIEFTQSYSVWG